MKSPDPFDVWEITARDWTGAAIERRHRLTGDYQHIRFNEKGKWIDGRLPYQGA